MCRGQGHTCGGGGREQWQRLRCDAAGRYKYPSGYTLGSCEDNLQGRTMIYLSSGKKIPQSGETRPRRRETNGKADEKGLENGTSVNSCHRRQKSLGGAAGCPSRLVCEMPALEARGLTSQSSSGFSLTACSSKASLSKSKHPALSSTLSIFVGGKNFAPRGLKQNKTKTKNNCLMLALSPGPEASEGSKVYLLRDLPQRPISTYKACAFLDMWPTLLG